MHFTQVSIQPLYLTSIHDVLKLRIKSGSPTWDDFMLQTPKSLGATKLRYQVIHRLESISLEHVLLEPLHKDFFVNYNLNYGANVRLSALLVV